MPSIRLANRNAPFGELLRGALGYPLRGAALAALVGLSLAHYAGLVPVLGGVFDLIIWAPTYLYALECLRHTADGYADAPEINGDNTSAGWIIIGVLILGMALTGAVTATSGIVAGMLVSLVLALIMPAIVMSLAFGDGWGTALNPATWIQAMARFGAPYFLLVGVQLLIAWLQGMALAALDRFLPMLLSIPLYYGVAIWATIFNFHLMGLLMFRHAERIGLTPEAPELARATGQNADDELLAAAHESERGGDPEAALAVLRRRLDARAAPASMHLALRAMLQRHHGEAEMRSRAARLIDALLADDDESRALGIVNETIQRDPDWLPDEPTVCGRLADVAAHRGMSRLALKLARGIPNRWPGDPNAARYGLLAARLLARLGQRDEAAVLAGKLLVAWPNCAERDAIDAFIASLKPDAATP